MTTLALTYDTVLSTLQDSDDAGYRTQPHRAQRTCAVLNHMDLWAMKGDLWVRRICWS